VEDSPPEEELFDDEEDAVLESESESYDSEPDEEVTDSSLSLGCA
jgi:hypothetical protein